MNKILIPFFTLFSPGLPAFPIKEFKNSFQNNLRFDENARVSKVEATDQNINKILPEITRNMYIFLYFYMDMC